jgi:hypothetical protein
MDPYVRNIYGSGILLLRLWIQIRSISLCQGIRMWTEKNYFYCKLSEIWSGMFIPDSGFGSWFFTHPGSWIQESKRSRIPEPDPQHCDEKLCLKGCVSYPCYKRWIWLQVSCSERYALLYLGGRSCCTAGVLWWRAGPAIVPHSETPTPDKLYSRSSGWINNAREILEMCHLWRMQRYVSAQIISELVVPRGLVE